MPLFGRPTKNDQQNQELYETWEIALYSPKLLMMVVFVLNVMRFER